LAAVRFDTLFGLTKLLAAPQLANDSRSHVSDPIVAAAVRTVLAKSADLLAPVASHPATEQAMVRVHRELRELDSEDLDQLASQRPQAAEVVRLHRLIHQRLTKVYFDEVDLTKAARLTVTEGHSLYGDLGAVVVHLPERPTNSGLALLQAFAAQGPLAVVVGCTGDEAADQPAQLLVERLGGTFAPPALTSLAGQLSVCSVADPDEEARMAVRQIMMAAAQGTPFSRMAIAHPGTDQYARLLHQHLRSAGLAFNGVADRSLGESLAGRTLLALLKLADQDFSRTDVMALVSSGGISDGTGQPVSDHRWEHVARQAGITSGFDQWGRRITQFVVDEEQRQAEEAVADNSSHQQWREENISEARQLLAFVERLAGAVGAVSSRASWSELSTWAHDLLKQYLTPLDQRSKWPEEEAEAHGRVVDLLRSLSRLETVEKSPGLSTFHRAVRQGLDRDLDRSGRFGEGVLVGGFSVVAGIDLDHVVVMGLAEGVTPSRRRDDPLLPESLRRSTQGSLTTRTDKQDLLHHNLLAIFAAAAQQRVLSFPRGDLGAKIEMVPSRWLLDQIEAKTGTRPSPEDLEKTTAEWFSTSASFVDTLGSSNFPLDEQEYALAELLRHGYTGAPLQASSRAKTDVIINRGAHLAAQRELSALTPYDGLLASSHLPSPADGKTIVSATRLQSWVRCPYAYFVEQVLKVRAPLQPSDEDRINPLNRGTMAHKILERFILAGLEANDLPKPSTPWSEHHRQRLHELAQEEFIITEDRGLAGQPLLWEMECAHLLRSLDSFLIDDNEFRKEKGATPWATELSFGFNGASPYVHVLPDGRKIKFRGSIDRVDATLDGRLVISDYKTGKAEYFKKLSEANPDDHGQYLQLPLYGLAARFLLEQPESGVYAQYWFLTDQGTMHGYQLNEQVLNRFDEVLATITNSIKKGLFPARPAKDHHYGLPCDFCDPDGLGTASAYDRWLLKQDDPILDAYRSLIGELKEEEITATICLEGTDD
jgi:RecB family exonuclease